MTTESGGTCAVCGNFYDKAFTVIDHEGSSSVFDSIECAARWIAPECAHCRTRILGHGVESSGGIFCCAHCASRAGETGLTDRVDASDVSRHGPDATG